MTGLETVGLVVVVLWFAVLTLAALICIRQMTVLTARVEATFDYSAADDGLPVGAAVPAAVDSAMSNGTANRQWLVLFLSATCKPCRETAATLGQELIQQPLTVLLAGPDDLASAVSELLPSDAHVVRDPLAQELATMLNIRSTPFALALRDGRIVGKTYVNGPADIKSLAAESATAAESLTLNP